MQTKGKTATAALVVAGIMSGQVWAKPTMPQSHMSKNDRNWLMASADGELKEIALGHLVSRRAKSPAVKRFAQQMIKDHSKAQAELQKLAKSKGVPLPTHLGKKNRETLEHMTRLSPRRLDHDYMENMVADHYKDVKDFSDEAKKGDDKDVRAWARKTVPVLQMHLQMARDTARGIVSAGKS